MDFCCLWLVWKLMCWLCVFGRVKFGSLLLIVGFVG